MIIASFGSYNGFREAFIKASLEVGIGWVCLVQEGDKIRIARLEYNRTPIQKQVNPLLIIDVWEHAYYLDYQDDRQKYIEGILANLLNWQFAESNLK
jgi:Fe-Mn family superoxide dismutase